MTSENRTFSNNEPNQSAINEHEQSNIINELNTIALNMCSSIWNDSTDENTTEIGRIEMGQIETEKTQTVQTEEPTELEIGQTEIIKEQTRANELQNIANKKQNKANELQEQANKAVNEAVATNNKYLKSADGRFIIKNTFENCRKYKKAYEVQQVAIQAQKLAEDKQIIAEFAQKNVYNLYELSKIINPSIPSIDSIPFIIESAGKNITEADINFNKSEENTSQAENNKNALENILDSIRNNKTEKQTYENEITHLMSNISNILESFKEKYSSPTKRLALNEHENKYDNVDSLKKFQNQINEDVEDIKEKHKELEKRIKIANDLQIEANQKHFDAFKDVTSIYDLAMNLDLNDISHDNDPNKKISHLENLKIFMNLTGIFTKCILVQNEVESTHEEADYEFTIASKKLNKIYYLALACMFDQLTARKVLIYLNENKKIENHEYEELHNKQIENMTKYLKPIFVNDYATQISDKITDEKSRDSSHLFKDFECKNITILKRLETAEFKYSSETEKELLNKLSIMALTNSFDMDRIEIKSSGPNNFYASTTKEETQKTTSITPETQIRGIPKAIKRHGTELPISRARTGTNSSASRSALLPPIVIGIKEQKPGEITVTGDNKIPSQLSAGIKVTGSKIRTPSVFVTTNVKCTRPPEAQTTTKSGTSNFDITMSAPNKPSQISKQYQGTKFIATAASGTLNVGLTHSTSKLLLKTNNFTSNKSTSFCNNITTPVRNDSFAVTSPMNESESEQTTESSSTTSEEISQEQLSADLKQQEANELLTRVDNQIKKASEIQNEVNDSLKAVINSFNKLDSIIASGTYDINQMFEEAKTLIEETTQKQLLANLEINLANSWYINALDMQDIATCEQIEADAENASNKLHKQINKEQTKANALKARNAKLKLEKLKNTAKINEAEYQHYFFKYYKNF